MANKDKKYFFGWGNIKWVIKELFAMYSAKDSYFSKKRIESALAFLGGYWIVLYHAWACRETITNSEIIADATLLFVIAGYTVRQIQSEKKELPAVNNEKAPEVVSEPKKDESPEEGQEGI